MIDRGACLWLKQLLRDSEMPGVARAHVPRFALGLSADFRTTPGLIFFYSRFAFYFSDVSRAFWRFKA
jgi:hypothetical protein